MSQDRVQPSFYSDRLGALDPDTRETREKTTFASKEERQAFEIEQVVERELEAARLAATTGVGAWSTGFYKYGWKAGDDERRRAGIAAIKAALADNGFAKGLDFSQYGFGDACRARTKEFQAANGLTVDGVVGPTTARFLWRHYAVAVEVENGIPNHWVGRIATGESNNDPVAEGVLDPDDEGIVQIHLPFHPEISLIEAWTPAIALEYAARRLASDFRYTGHYKAAVAAWNIGRVYAKLWAQAGYPAEGGPILGVDDQGKEIDAYTRATNYYLYVRALAS